MIILILVYIASIILLNVFEYKISEEISLAKLVVSFTPIVNTACICMIIFLGLCAICDKADEIIIFKKKE